MFPILLEWQDKLIMVSMLYARIMPIFLIVPVLNEGILAGNFLRNAVILAVVIGLWPALVKPEHLPAINDLAYTIMIGKEIIVGVSLGFALALPFWIFSAVGGFIDIARGSSMGSLVDPTNGQESTEIQNFVNFAICAVYVQLGGLTVFLDTLLNSYKLIAIGQNFTVNLNLIFPFLGEIFKHGVMVSSPILFALFISEVLLGVLNRFTPELNAFSLSLTVKSLIAVAIMTVYFWQILPGQTNDFILDYSKWQLLHGVSEE